MGFSRQEYWSELPFPSPGDLPDPRIKPRSPALQTDALPSKPPGKRDYKETWASKNWCFWSVVLEKTLESPLDCKEIQPVHPKGNKSWICIGRTDAEAEAPILWSFDVRSQFIGKDPEAGKDWREEDQGWNGCMASPIQWTWVCASSSCWWWTGRPGMLQFMGLQIVGHNWVTELKWTEPAIWK